MLFNSTVFAFFFVAVFFAYWALPSRRAQNFLLLVASYVFYGWWDHRFLALIAISSICDYVVGQALERERAPLRRKCWLLLSLVVNLGVLGFFKYYDFFVSSLGEGLQRLDIHVHLRTLNVILPVGISFYTFQTMSYTIDIYRRQLRPVRDPIAFFAFVSFFPQLVAGPIERASNLLPQFSAPRQFSTTAARDGIRQMLWGFFKKLVVADNIALFVDQVYANSDQSDGLTLLIGTFLFAIQIYCDFSGYSDIAIGAARLLGFELCRNFAFPYFSRSIGEFWRRWHISLSTWFRDYVYIPLGGSRAKKRRHIVNVVVTFGLSGLWHGANWTFLVWGLLHAAYYIPSILRPHRAREADVVAEGRLLPSGRDALRMLTTFTLVLLAWVFFRADSVSHACEILATMFTQPYAGLGYRRFAVPLLLCAGLLAAEWINRERQHTLSIARLPPVVRWGAYYAALTLIIYKGNTGHVPFIYFQF